MTGIPPLNDTILVIPRRRMILLRCNVPTLHLFVYYRQLRTIMQIRLT